MIDASIKAEFLGDKFTLFRRTRNSDRTCAFNACDLTHYRTDCSGRSGHHHRFAFFRLPNVQQTGVSSNARHSQNSCRCGNGRKFWINFFQFLALLQPKLLPTAVTENKITYGVSGTFRFNYLTDSTGAHNFINFYRWSIGLTRVHPPTHVRIKR